MNASIQEAMERSRRFFSERSAAGTTERERELYDQLRQVAKSVEETASLVEHLRIQLEDVRRAVGLHLESRGSVPHTRRGRPRQGAGRAG